MAGGTAGMQFRILGPLEIESDGERIELAGAAQRALLARLLLDANHVVSAEQLMADLWTTPPDSGAAALHQRMVKLRQALAPGRSAEALIATHDAGYVIRLGEGQLDLHRFEAGVRAGEQALARGDPAGAAGALQEALTLWRGKPLTEFADAPFATPAGGRIEELHLMALETRIEADLELGRHLALIGELEALVHDQPFREAFRAKQMLALYRAGRQAEALEAYQRLRQTLVDELGVEPTQALQELERAILNHDRALDAKPVEQPRVADEPAESPPRSILVFPSDVDSLEALIGVAEPLTCRPRREIVLTALASSGAELDGLAEVLERRRQDVLSRGVATRAAAFTSESVGADLVRLIGTQEVDLVLTDAPPQLISEGQPPDALQTILLEAPCDVAALVPGERPISEGIRDIVVPFGGHEHDWAALEMAAWIAASQGASLELLGTDAQPDQDKRDASRLLADVSLAVQRTTGVGAKPRLVAAGPSAMLHASRESGLLVVGLSERWEDEGLGPARLMLAQSEGPTTLFVRRGVRQADIAPPERFTRYTWSLAEAMT